MAVDVESYFSDGYQVVRGAIPEADIGEFRLRIETLDAVYDTAENLETGSYQDRKYLRRGELPLAARVQPWLQLVLGHDVLDVFCAIAGAPWPCLRAHHPPSIRVSKPGKTAGNVPWHQDWVYNQHLEFFTTAWVPLTPISVDGGGVTVRRGSHRLGKLPHRLCKHGVWDYEVEPASLLALCPTVDITMDVGDVLLFSPRLVHCTRPNESGETRYSIDYRLFPITVATSKRYYDFQKRAVVCPPEAQ